jgi:predicted RNase H-like nuclease
VNAVAAPIPRKNSEGRVIDIPGRGRSASVVGVDLAWGRRAPSGLCAVAPDGTVVASATLATDDQIIGWIGEHAPGAAVVGFDAPLAVTNPSGRRRCEELVSRAFRAQGAGAYPSNRSMPAFVDGGRAAALARRLGLALDPDDAERSRRGLAVEVYPHSALVALFGLPTRLTYKAGRGRGVELRRAEMARLVGLIEALAGRDPGRGAGAGPRWQLLCSAVTGAARHVDLERVEDELDAHVCAYVARSLAADLRDGGGRVRVLGDWASGAIVTPVDERQAVLLDPASPAG